MAESLNGIYKTECYNRRESWEDAPEIELDTSSWAFWYNSARPHLSLGGLTPIEYENAYYNGELPKLGDAPEDPALRGPNGRYLPRDNGRDINPRSREHAG
jgi:hypothetical protein